MNSVLKIVSGVFIAGFLTIGVLSSVKQPPNSKTMQDNTIAKAYMDKNKDQYAKCKNSLGLGKTKIYQVTQTYIKFENTKAQNQHAQDTEKNFIKKLEKECNPTIKGYEANFEIYKTTMAELARADRSLLDDILGIKSESEQTNLFEYQPSAVAMLTGVSIDESLVFSEQDVKSFYKKEMGK